MPNWERKQTDTLAEAIGKHLRNKPGLTEANARLREIQVAVDAAANTVATTEGDLNHHRAQVCLICRSFKLYACDVPEGWSDNCGFIYANASEFSPL